MFDYVLLFQEAGKKENPQTLLTSVPSQGGYRLTLYGSFGSWTNVFLYVFKTE